MSDFLDRLLAQSRGEGGAPLTPRVPGRFEAVGHDGDGFDVLDEQVAAQPPPAATGPLPPASPSAAGVVEGREAPAASRPVATPASRHSTPAPIVEHLHRWAAEPTGKAAAEPPPPLPPTPAPVAEAIAVPPRTSSPEQAVAPSAAAYPERIIERTETRLLPLPSTAADPPAAFESKVAITPLFPPPLPAPAAMPATASATPTGPSPPPPMVQVRIGRIEIEAAPDPVPRPRASARNAGALALPSSLDRYLGRG